jgi:hypothetical protein
MPKQSTRVRVATAVTVQDPANQIHCRKLDQVLQGAADKARLRGTLRGKMLELQAKPHRDGLIRRLFSRDHIELERLAVRAALIAAAANVTPDRLRRLGSPGRRAVRALRDAAGLDLDRDVRAGQVRSATALLAGGKKKRAYIDTPVKSRSAWLAQTGASTLASTDGVRRVQLRTFCGDTGAAASLGALLARSKDKPVLIAASISIFRAATLSFILADMKSVKPGPQALAVHIRKSSESMLLRLFIARWLEAAAAGSVTKRVFPWFDAVNWLVVAMHGARPTSPGASRPPKSARVVSPSSAAPAQAPSAAPAAEPAPARRARRRAAAPAPAVQVRNLPPSPYAAPRPGLPQQGRQSVSLRMLNQLRSPTRLSGTPAPQASPATQVKVRRTATLLDTAMALLASQNAAASGSGGADSQLLGSPGAPGADTPPDNGQ